MKTKEAVQPTHDRNPDALRDLLSEPSLLSHTQRPAPLSRNRRHESNPGTTIVGWMQRLRAWRTRADSVPCWLHGHGFPVTPHSGHMTWRSISREESRVHPAAVCLLQPGGRGQGVCTL